MSPPDRKCATCGAMETAHYRPGELGALVLGHRFAVRRGDEWCDDCEDWIVNGCRTVDVCEDRAREREAELADERGGT
jgi:hypothetical protein